MQNTVCLVTGANSVMGKVTARALSEQGQLFSSCAEANKKTVICRATAPELNNATGEYFFDKEEIRSSKISYDPGAAKRLWDVSAQLTRREKEQGW